MDTTRRCSHGPNGAWTLPNEQMVVAQKLAYAWVKYHHNITHREKIATNELLRHYYYIPKLASICASVSQRCQTCAMTEAPSGPKPPPGIQHAGLRCFEDLQVDFTEVKPCRVYKYLLVIVCT